MEGVGVRPQGTLGAIRPSTRMGAPGDIPYQILWLD